MPATGLLDSALAWLWYLSSFLLVTQIFTHHIRISLSFDFVFLPSYIFILEALVFTSVYYFCCSRNVGVGFLGGTATGLSQVRLSLLTAYYLLKGNNMKRFAHSNVKWTVTERTSSWCRSVIVKVLRSWSADVHSTSRVKYHGRFDISLQSSTHKSFLRYFHKH